MARLDLEMNGNQWTFYIDPESKDFVNSETMPKADNASTLETPLLPASLLGESRTSQSVQKNLASEAAATNGSQSVTGTI